MIKQVVDNIVKSTPSVFSKTLTCGDTPKYISTENVPCYEVNFHIYDNDVYYGNGIITDAVAQANSVLSFRNCDVHDFFFKNKTAGNNGKVVCVATVPIAEVLNQLRL